MSVKEVLKKNDFLRRIVKKLKIQMEFLGDAKDFSSNYLEVSEKKGDPRYRIMLLVHSLEKGLCMPNMRPFGQSKALQLMNILLKTGRKKDMEFEYDLGISALCAWTKIYDEFEWEKDIAVKQVEKFLADKPSTYEAGRKIYANPYSADSAVGFREVMLSRHSVRDFEERELDEEDINYALQMFIEAPTACNRQMCKVYHVKNKELVDFLNSTVLGVGGFNKATMHYFIITCDLAAFEFYGERNQGYLNAGLVAMNFANGLHARGIGSCFMQWSNKRSEDLKARQALGLSKSEKIALVLGAGYYKKESYIPCSCRRSIKDVYSVVE